MPHNRTVCKELAFLHSHKTIHSGFYTLTLSEREADWLVLHLGNMAFTIPNINLNPHTFDELYVAIGEPVMLPVDIHPLWREDPNLVSHQSSWWIRRSCRIVVLVHILVAGS